MRAFCLLLLSLLMMVAFQRLSAPDQYPLTTRPLSFVVAAKLTVPPRQSQLGRKLMTAPPSLASPELDAAAGRRNLGIKADQLGGGDGRDMAGRAAGEMGDPAGGGVESDGVIIYEVDYHGVTTHPSPRPKHPKAP